MNDELTGEVTRFKGNGRKFGYPTANLSIETELQDGVYFGYADLHGYQDHPSLIFVGVPTTVGDKERRVETHLLDIPDIDYYGETLTVRPRHFHRTNLTFDSIAELLEIMKHDDIQARDWFERETIA